MCSLIRFWDTVRTVRVKWKIYVFNEAYEYPRRNAMTTSLATREAPLMRRTRLVLNLGCLWRIPAFTNLVQFAFDTNPMGLVIVFH